MKVLVAARRLAADRTSEGICSAKYVAALAGAGIQVRCLTGDEVPPAQMSWHVTHAPIWKLGDASPGALTWCARGSDRLAARGGAGRLAARKLNGLSARASGYALTTWVDVRRWRRALAATIRLWQPDAVVIRGAGREFEPHLAMLGWQPGVPWVAHYHDPYPGSLYPEPYRLHVPLQSPRQERAHRHIVAAADALTFPSRRLLEWVLRDDLRGARHKAFVVPHVAGGWSLPAADDVPPVAMPPSALTLLHAGTLLRERDPRPLLSAVQHFVGNDARRAAQLRLVFMGRVDATHLASPEWQALTAAGILACVNERVSYGRALAAARAATALVILEPAAAESPFFPAKLADSLAAGRPILAVTPDASVTSDLLGRDHPLRVPAGDRARMLAAIERLWSAWVQGDVAGVLPPRTALAPLHESAVGAAAAAVFAHVLDTRRGRVA